MMKKSQKLQNWLVTTRISTKVATKPYGLQNIEAPKFIQQENIARRSSIQIAPLPDYIWLFSVVRI